MDRSNRFLRFIGGKAIYKCFSCNNETTGRLCRECFSKNKNKKVSQSRRKK